ncbi:MAG TPA: hypothetical protein VGP94_02190 [Tepidisphaeraceae bacterium]|nr:hypothetical protein [Tepidisphaeraceae bacterium]
MNNKRVLCNASARLQIANRKLQILTNFIPGRLILRAGTRADYKTLERFHYIAGPPATWAQIWTIDHESGDDFFSDPRSSALICGSSLRPAIPIAIAVLSHPCLNCHARDRVLNLTRLSPKKRQHFINQNIRTISRLIVHPTYRGLSLASILINCILSNCTTRYTEAIATMAKAHPLFLKSGMKEFPPDDDDTKPHYYLFDHTAPNRSHPFRPIVAATQCRHTPPQRLKEQSHVGNT